MKKMCVPVLFLSLALFCCGGSSKSTTPTTTATTTTASTITSLKMVNGNAKFVKATGGLSQVTSGAASSAAVMRSASDNPVTLALVQSMRS